MSDAFYAAIPPTIVALSGLIISIWNNIRIASNDKKTDDLSTKSDAINQLINTNTDKLAKQAETLSNNVEVVHRTINSNHSKEMEIAEKIGTMKGVAQQVEENKASLIMEKQISHLQGKQEQIQIQKNEDKIKL